MSSEKAEVKSEKVKVQIQCSVVVKYNQCLTLSKEDAELLQTHHADDVTDGDVAHDVLEVNLDHAEIYDSEGEYNDFRVQIMEDK